MHPNEKLRSFTVWKGDREGQLHHDDAGCGEGLSLYLKRGYQRRVGEEGWGCWVWGMDYGSLNLGSWKLGEIIGVGHRGYGGGYVGDVGDRYGESKGKF